MATRITLVGLRRTVLARGLTMKPACPGCARQVEPADLDMATGVCFSRCARRALALRRLDVIDAKLATLWQANRETPCEALDDEIASLEGERLDLYWTEVADPSEASHA